MTQKFYLENEIKNTFLIRKKAEINFWGKIYWFLI